MSFDLKQAFTNAIDQTLDPMAPIKLQECHSYAIQVGQMLACISDKSKVKEMTNHMLSPFPDDMDHIACDPNYITALCMMLAEALTQYGMKLGAKP